MSVKWSWEQKMGSIQWKNLNGKNITVNVYQSNCLCTMIHTYKKDGKILYEYCGHFEDINHLKRCIGLSKNYVGTKKNGFKNAWTKWKLNTYYKESFSIARQLVKAGFKVELYYKEINNESIHNSI